MSVVDATKRIEEAALGGDQQKREAQAMAGLMNSQGWPVFESLVDQIANRYMQQLLTPLEKQWQGDFLRGLIKGLDVAKSLPSNVISLYNQQQDMAENESAKKGAAAPSDNPEMRLSPEPGESNE